MKSTLDKIDEKYLKPVIHVTITILIICTLAVTFTFGYFLGKNDSKLRVVKNLETNVMGELPLAGAYLPGDTVKILNMTDVRYKESTRIVVVK